MNFGKVYCRWKWKSMEREAFAYAECRDVVIVFDTIHGFIYCPYCGRKIKIIK